MKRGKHRKPRATVTAEVARLVRQRDGYRCLWCGTLERERPLHIAHIRSRGARPDLINDPRNLCLLCGVTCHLNDAHAQGTLSSEALEERMTARYGYDYPL